MTAEAETSAVVLSASKNASASTSSLALHPLPILNISEHIVRSTLQSSSAPIKVYGALLGTQSGRDIEVHNTFEFKVFGGTQVDHAFLKSRQAQFKQVFPTFEFLGWYSNGSSSPMTRDMDIHKQLLEYNEAPLFLQISPSDSQLAVSSKAGELPLQLYESQMELSSTADPSSPQAPAVQLYFTRSSYKIQTGEAERIAVDYTARPSVTGAEGDAGNAIATLTTQQSAIRMLAERIQIAQDYVSAVRNGTAPRDHETLRKIKAVLASMPAMDSDEFREEFLREYSDVMLTSYLSSLTRGLHGLNELVDKFDMVASSYNAPAGDGSSLAARERRMRR